MKKLLILLFFTTSLSAMTQEEKIKFNELKTFISPYKILSIPVNATKNQIEKLSKKLLEKFHPEKSDLLGINKQELVKISNKINNAKKNLLKIIESPELKQTYQKQLILMILNNNLEKVKDLIKRGADVNEIYKPLGVRLAHEFIPIHSAVRKQNDEIIKVLIDAGANLEVKNQENLTPLYVAVKGKNNKIIKLLINRGANIQETLNIAKKRRDLETIMILKKYLPIKSSNLAILSLELYSLEKIRMK